MGAFKGRYLTIVALMCCLAAATIGVAQNTPGVFYATVADDLGVAVGTYSFFGTTQLLTIAFMSLVVPSLLKVFGIKWMIILSMVCMSASTLVLAYANQLPIIYACGAVRGVGCAIAANIPITMTINNWFHESNGTATSIALSFSGLMGAICSPILTWAIGAFGWQVAYLVQAGMLFGLMLPPLFVPLHLTPEEEGLVPYGEEGSHSTRDDQRAARQAKENADLEAVDELLSPAPAPKEEVAQAAPPTFTFATLAFGATAVFIFLFCLITGLAQHIAGYAVAIGFDAGFGALLMSLSMVGNICSKLLIGVLADRLGALRSSMVMMVINAVALALILFGATTHAGWMMAVGAVSYGSVYAVAAVGVALLTRQFFGEDNYARAFPVLSLIGSVGCAVAIPAMGYVFDFTGSYNVAVIACLVFDVVAFVLLTVASRAAATKEA